MKNKTKKMGNILVNSQGFMVTIFVKSVILCQAYSIHYKEQM